MRDAFAPEDPAAPVTRRPKGILPESRVKDKGMATEAADGLRGGRIRLPETGRFTPYPVFRTIMAAAGAKRYENIVSRGGSR